jgi:hypothetical protein
VLWYEFYKSSAADVRRKSRTFYHVQYHQTPGEIQYCLGRKTSEPVSLNFCDQGNIAFSLGV